MADELERLRKENETLKEANALLEKGVATMSAGYLAMRLREHREVVDSQGSRLGRVEADITKARTAFQDLDKRLKALEGPK